MDKLVFADGIGSVSVVGGTVRLDLVVLSPTERDANGQPKAIFQQQIIMSTEGFLRTAGKVQEAALAISKVSAKQPIAGPGTQNFRAAPAEATTESVGQLAPAQQKGGGSKPPFP